MKDYEALSRKHFDAQAPVYDKRDTVYYSREGKISCRDIANQLKNISYEKLLDVGCGTGFLIELLSKHRRAEYIGLDLSGALFGIEIKSDADTYARLSRQVKDYDRYFDRNIVAVGASHGHHIREHVPDYWGVITVEEVGGELDFYELRKPQNSPKAKMANQLSLLWKRELSNIQSANGLYRYAGKNKRYIAKYLMDVMPDNLLKKAIIEELFERDYTTIR